VIRAKILHVMMCVYKDNPLFCRGGVKITIFTWDLEPNYRG